MDDQHLCSCHCGRWAGARACKGRVAAAAPQPEAKPRLPGLQPSLCLHPTPASCGTTCARCCACARSRLKTSLTRRAPLQLLPVARSCPPLLLLLRSAALWSRIMRMRMLHCALHCGGSAAAPRPGSPPASRPSAVPRTAAPVRGGVQAGMELRVLHAAARRMTWYGQWHYGFGRGGFNMRPQQVGGRRRGGIAAGAGPGGVERGQQGRVL